MVTVTIDGNEVQVAEGTNLVEAAAKTGIEIPTYCYHPGLSVVGQCRICFVEVEGLPRLVTACSTPVQDGMVVATASDRVREARAAVMEFLLENHPLDCPVCDQAGECLLQDYSVDHGLDSTHMVDEKRTYPAYERRAIGPHVVQNQNRCIHCTRCIRFTQEISETHDLTMKSRGNHSYIDTFDGKPLDNPWSACVADVCPVGALTVKEFRFRARVWHLDETPSVCFGCSIGCNITINHLDGTVHRFVPRSNYEVNGWWICDHGRFLAESLNRRELAEPRGPQGEALSWADASSRLAEVIGSGARVVASANLSNEALYLCKQILVNHAGLEVVVPTDSGEQRQIKNARDEWISSQDSHPNSAGARLIGLPTVDGAGLAEFVTATNAPLLVLDNLAHSWLDSEQAREALIGRRLVVCGRLHTYLSRAADLVLPATSWIETEGTYTSSTGRVQLARRGLFAAGQAKTMREILSLLAVEMGLDRPARPTAREIFQEVAAEVPAFAGMTYKRLDGEAGLPVLEEAPHVA